MYYYWAKCEWEVIISAWPPNENAKKEILKRYNASKHKRKLVPVYTFKRKNYLKDVENKENK